MGVELPGSRVVVDAGGPLDVEVVETTHGWGWSVANGGGEPVAVRSVALEWDGGPARPGTRFFRHGYQSWSPTAVARLGVDDDPSRAAGALSLVRGMHHADPAVAPAGQLRSEAVTVVERDDGRLLCAGFDAGVDHDGTFRAWLDGDRLVLRAEAHLGGAVLAPGERRPLHPVDLEVGDDASALLQGWAERAGDSLRARRHGPFQVGWCSWYQYFHDVTEEDLRSNLALGADWPFDVVQLDDGYQPAIGDWLTTNDRFPSDLDVLAATIRDAGRTPGIWLAPFLVAPDSEVATAHPDWVARWRDGSPLVGMVNEAWGGLTWVLDTTNPDVLAHIEAVARSLVEAGFPYLKLDFTYAPSLDGVYADRSATPAQRVRAGFDAVRRGAGEDAFLLGCGAPLAAVVGVVDGMRIGPDVAPRWAPPAGRSLPGYGEVGPATRNAWRNALSRSFQHRRLWLNDPDCLMLRTADTELSPETARAWALAVAVSGGMALVSDDLALLGDDARRLLDEVVALGRAADDGARRGPAPRCDDLFASPLPTRLTSAAGTLAAEVDDSGARATLTVRR